MLIASIQVLLLAGAAALLFRLWRIATPAEKWLRLIVVCGFLARAVAGQALFWISWAEVPIARSMQTGNGLWFFATDAALYVENASQAASEGVWAIVTFERTSAAVTFTQVLSTAMLLFGDAASGALLVNLFSYLGMVAILLHWRRREPHACKAVAFAIAGISLSPTFILWSLQPLKDPLFQFLVVAFVAACAAWQRAWVERRQTRPQIMIAALMLACLYAIAGVRWYFAVALLIATSLFLVLVIFTTRVRRTAAAAAATAMVFLLATAVLFSARPYLPPTVLLILQPWTATGGFGALPVRIVREIDLVREGFNRTGGATLIRAGRGVGPATPAAATAAPLVPAPRTPARPPPAATSIATATTPPPSPPVGLDTPPASSTIASARTPDNAAGVNYRPPARATTPRIVASPDDHPDVVQVRTMLASHVEAWNSGDMKRVEAFWSAPDAPFLAAIRRTPTQRPTGRLRALESTIQIEDEQNAVVNGRWEWTNYAGRVQQFKSTLRLRRTDFGWKIAGGGTPGREEIPERQQDIGANSTSRTMRLLSGASATVIPRSIGERLGLFSIGGGHGLFWFVELDTLVFDVVLVLSLTGVVTLGRRAIRNPLTVLVLLFTLLVGVPLIYTVTNFGTLFRLREMIYLGLLLAPAAAASRVGGATPVNT